MTGVPTCSAHGLDALTQLCHGLIFNRICACQDVSLQRTI